MRRQRGIAPTRVHPCGAASRQQGQRLPPPPQDGPDPAAAARATPQSAPRRTAAVAAPRAARPPRGGVPSGRGSTFAKSRSAEPRAEDGRPRRLWREEERGGRWAMGERGAGRRVKWARKRTDADLVSAKVDAQQRSVDTALGESFEAHPEFQLRHPPHDREQCAAGLCCLGSGGVSREG